MCVVMRTLGFLANHLLVWVWRQTWSNMTEQDRRVAETCVKLADSATTGPDPGMVLVTVNCFTGYAPTQESLQLLKEHPQVRA